MDFLTSIPGEAWYALGGLIVGFFGRLLVRKERRDQWLDIAMGIVRTALNANMTPDTDSQKHLVREAVVETVTKNLERRGVDKGAENLARLALEQVLREKKTGESE